MPKQQQLQDSINDIVTRLDKIEEQEIANKLRGMDRRLHKSNTRVSNLRISIKGAVALVSLLAAVLTILIYIYDGRIAKYEKVEAAQPEIYKLLFVQLRRSTTEVVNGMFVQLQSKELKDHVRDLRNEQASLAKLDFEGKDFESLSKLIAAAVLLIREGDEKQAREKLDQIVTENDDAYTTSRALAIRRLIEINHDSVFGYELQKDLRVAIELDGTNALAFNCLGIATYNEVDFKLSEKGSDKKALLEWALQSLKNSKLDYQLAAGLDVSITGSFKRANNTVTANLLSAKACLDTNCLADEKTKTMFLSYLGYPSLEAFFQDSEAILDQYLTLRPDLLVARYTEGQLLCVAAQYQNSIGQRDEANVLRERAVDAFKKTVDFYQGQSCDSAFRDFEKDQLEAEVVNNLDYKEQIEKEIRKVCIEQKEPKDNTK